MVSHQCNDSLNITYIEEVKLSDCDPVYLEAVACKLASEICLTLTGDINLSTRLKVEYDERIKKAQSIDDAEEMSKIVKAQNAQDYVY